MRQLLLAAALAALGSTGAATVGSAADSASWIVVKDPWLRATPNGAKVAGGYVTITNTGTSADTLVAATISAAPVGEIHTMSMENGVMHMGRLDHGLAIPPGATITLKPGGDHLMFLNPTAPIKEGESMIGSLTFAKAGVRPVAFAVGGMAAKAAPGH
jgi:copper(I)-binding protein